MLDIFSWEYLAFAVVVTAVYWLLVPQRARPYFLMVAGALLILVQPPKFFMVTIVYLAATWYIGHLVYTAQRKSTRKFFLTAGIVASIGLIIYYKYGVFGDVHALSVLGSQGGGLASALGPLGISYFTFRVIHYMVEVYREKFPPANVADYLLYVTFFPTVLAGPIERFDAFQPQRVAGQTFNSDDFLYGLGRITQGLFKKLVVSATLYQMITPYYAAVGPGGNVLLSTGQIWLIHNIYFFYLYMDFSGYSDIAIGTARLFGYRIMENFNWPFLKPNVGLFWMSWHISLTRWLQKYVYWSLGGNKKGLPRSIIYTFITFGLLGAWHGSGSGLGHYVLFGFYHAILVIVYRFWRKFRTTRLKNIKPTKVGYVISVIFTLQVLNLGWPIFLHPTWKALTIYAKAFGFDVNIRMMMFHFFKALGG